MLGISNLYLKKDKACEIRFKVIPEVDGNFVNTLYISAAAEGGEEIGPIEAVAVTVRGEEIPTIEDIIEESNINEATPISEDEPSSTESTEAHNEENVEPIENPTETAIDPQQELSEDQATEEPELTDEVTEETEEEVAEAPVEENPDSMPEVSEEADTQAMKESELGDLL